jgi:putative transposase
MINLESKLKGKPSQFGALDEAIRTTQFIRNKCLRRWDDGWGITADDLNRYCRILAQEYVFVRKLNSMARQAAAERAAVAIRRFYDRCKQRRDKNGFPLYQKNCRSVEYKTTGWKLDALRRHLTITDGMGLGTFGLRGTRDLLGYALERIKRVRLLCAAEDTFLPKVRPCPGT